MAELNPIWINSIMLQYFNIIEDICYLCSLSYDIEYEMVYDIDGTDNDKYNFKITFRWNEGIETEVDRYRNIATYPINFNEIGLIIGHRHQTDLYGLIKKTQETLFHAVEKYNAPNIITFYDWDRLFEIIKRKEENKI